MDTLVATAPNPVPMYPVDQVDGVDEPDMLESC